MQQRRQVSSTIAEPARVWLLDAPTPVTVGRWLLRREIGSDHRRRAGAVQVPGSIRYAGERRACQTGVSRRCGWRAGLAHPARSASVGLSLAAFIAGYSPASAPMRKPVAGAAISA